MTAFTGDVAEAVKRFQEANGLVADGVLGQKTWAVLQEQATLAAEGELDAWDDSSEIEIIEEPTGVES
jgi:peptidoglycan hydrolase-like protein with peptidoglycan-binding domain